MNYHYLPIYILSIALGASYYLGYLPAIIFVIFGLLSILTYLIYVKDKKAARNNAWRTSEKTLHLYSLLCGWPGAIIAQQILRHKTQKQSFRVVFILTMLINIGFIAGLHTDQGSSMLRSYTYQLTNYVVVNIKNKQINKSAFFLFKFRTNDFIYNESDTFYIRESSKNR
tara:strand:- start:30318 stop:30827 length:510 start_codon:yes stop_codon:yes gene_type:complete